MENNEKRILNMSHPVDGYTVKELINDWFQNELNIDAINLGHIINMGKEEFNLNAEELENFVKIVIESFIKLGAKPVGGAKDKRHYWTVVNDYGVEPNEIADNIIYEYNNDTSSRDIDKGFWVWFARSEVYEEEKPTLFQKILNKAKGN